MLCVLLSTRINITILAPNQSMKNRYIGLLGFIDNSTIDDFKCISCVSDALEGMEAGCNDFIP